MKAVWYEKKGAAREVLVVGEMPTPEPGPDEVLVRIHASGLNPTDVKARSGWTGNKMPFSRVVPHQDGAGVIESVGPGGDESRIGQRVWVFEAAHQRPYGTAAEFSVVPGTNAVQMPGNISFAEAAAVPIPGMTAHRCLFMDGPIANKLILVTGGAGAVGNATIQLAKAAGAQVITTISRAEQGDIASAAGADFVINYKTEDVARKVKEIADRLEKPGVDRIVDVDFSKNIETSLAVLKPNGVIISYASGVMGTEAKFPYYAAMMKGVTMHFVLVYVMPAAAHLEAAEAMNTALAAGRYRPHIARRMRLDQIAEAHELQESGKVMGKVIIDLAMEK